MKIRHIILDTSIFVNPDSRTYFGNTVSKAFCNFLDLIKDKKHINCYIPPSTYEELTKFMEKLPPVEKTILINKKPPSSYQTPVSAMLVYEFIEEMRLRVNKGLRIAEKYTRKGLAAPVGEATPLGAGKAVPLEMPAKNERNEELIKSLRREYRTALREGIVDSKEDFDLILLAKELNAYLATSDQGLVKWAQKLGITCLNAEELKKIVTTVPTP